MSGTSEHAAVDDGMSPVASMSETDEGGLQTRSRAAFWVGAIVVFLSLLSGLATYLILTGLTPIVPTHRVVVSVLLINLVLVVAMIAVIAWQVTGLWLSRRRRAAGARLHVRIVSLFSIIAVCPAILLAIFASISLDRGLDHWFSARTKEIIQKSIDVATAYLKEHGQVIRADTIGMAQDIDAAVKLVKASPTRFGEFLSAQATIRSIPVAYLVDSKGAVLATASSIDAWKYRPPPEKAFELAKAGNVVTIAPGKTNMVGAIKSLQNFDDTYLYVIRPVNPQVLQYLRETRANAAEYQRLETRRAGVQVAFGLMYVAIALTLLLAAIWIGMWFANRLVSPIGRLIGAAEQVSLGHLEVQVPVKRADGDLGHLGNTFNRMTTELRSQRNELVDANSMLDERRRFTEAVLSGVTAGVVGLDAEGKVTLANRSAQEFLNLDEASLIGTPLAEAVPEFDGLLKKSREDHKNLVHDQVSLLRDTGERNLAVRVTTEGSGAHNYGYVVTFDDITELVTAQRTSAWADVARRIAHEIKNPLTPIQLSAERIRRKYGKVIETDRDIFEQCTDTIIRQVGDIGRMVDEFSSFARMPKPVMEPHDIREIVKEAVFLFQVGHADIKFESRMPDEAVMTHCDRRLINQAVTNLVKNAGEAIEAVQNAGDTASDYKGHVDVRVRTDDGRYVIEVTDNGVGLPKENRNRLVEPYMTTREKGTGLGLAIVQKIAEQHGGTIRLADAPKTGGRTHGARVRLDLPLIKPAEHDAPKQRARNGAAPSPAPEAGTEPAGDEQELSHGV